MRTVTRRLAIAAAGLAAACGLALPGTAAHAATGNYTPSSSEWWMRQWDVPQKVWPTTQGAGVTVAVLDSGVQASVPDLQGAVEPGADMLGYGGNGEKDYATGTDGHGTAVAVLLAGQGTDTGTVGIAPQAKILPIHVIDPTTNIDTSLSSGIKYAVDHGAKVINISNGAPVSSATACDPAEQAAVSYALAHDVVIVAAAGDTNITGSGPVQPASCAGVLAVGAVESDGSAWQNTPQQPYVSVVAPGDHMIYEGLDGRFTTIGAGTSFSAPLVSGAAALIRAANPSMPWYTVVQRLIATAIPDGPVPNNSTGYGIININKAVNTAQYPVAASAPNPVYARYQTWLQTPAGQQFAQANGISATNPGQTAPATSSPGSGPLIAILAAILVLLLAAGLIIARTTRKRH